MRATIPNSIPRMIPVLQASSRALGLKICIPTSLWRKDSHTLLWSTSPGVGDDGYVPVSNFEMVEKLEDDLNWMHGRHTVRFGADLQDWQDLRQSNPYSPHGQFTFNGQYSGLAGEVPNASGISDLADLELGYPASAGSTLTYTDANQVGGRFWSFYGQDDMKLTSNLSMNIGLRWEIRRPPVDKSNNVVQFVPVGPPDSQPGNGLLVRRCPTRRMTRFAPTIRI